MPIYAGGPGSTKVHPEPTYGCVELLGDTLQSKSGAVSTMTALEGKQAVALYFGAHESAPCRSFTSKLAKWYSENLQAKGLEVVFISSDRDEGAFNAHFGEMPWLALSYADRQRMELLHQNHAVQDLPTVVVLGPAGDVITRDGCKLICSDPAGRRFPWTSPVDVATSRSRALLGNCLSLMEPFIFGPLHLHVVQMLPMEDCRSSPISFHTYFLVQGIVILITMLPCAGILWAGLLVSNENMIKAENYEKDGRLEEALSEKSIGMQRTQRGVRLAAQMGCSLGVLASFMLVWVVIGILVYVNAGADCDEEKSWWVKVLGITIGGNITIGVIKGIIAPKKDNQYIAA
eukprot:gnl/TRDRNA2_/TRDRNA2_185457_c0_seq1.p1 gnl/TRDRNA2_/TRDRNA2_185457_c0~~gnl/TRDRNA2_/TRDRNA2_185457_c0_seq1.p1  ORF type:complete len:346 (+),score=49.14 gnl/TRDRNA2_/TRDRNA2_185457_c0_seq1:79-1116(+)